MTSDTNNWSRGEQADEAKSGHEFFAIFKE